MLEALLDMEKRFFRRKYISDRNWLETTIHNDFHECGKSGILFDKKETVESLLSCTDDRDITIYNFEYRPVTDKCYLVHYITQDGNEKYYRTSVWVMENSLKLFYHQASRLNSDVERLKKY